MEKLTFKQQLILALVAGIFVVIAAIISRSGSQSGMTVEGMHINAVPSSYSVSGGNSQSSINIQDSRVVSTNNSSAIWVNGNVVQGHNVSIK